MWTVDTFTTASIASGASLISSRSISIPVVNILKIKVTPSIIGGTSSVGIYKHATCLDADMVYKSENFNGILVDPTELQSSNQIERNEGFVAVYEDLDYVSQLYIKITNNGLTTKTYDVSISYSPIYPYITPQMFGAKGDGVTDDTAAIQSAITYAIANNLDLKISGMCLLTSPINIDRQVDGAAFDKYFVISSDNGGGFIIKSNMGMFSSSIAFTSSPVSQLVHFSHINFESDATGASRFVLNDGRFLRILFSYCSFDRINLVNSTIYTQTIYLVGNNIRRQTGTFFSSTQYSYDFKFENNIVESVTGNAIDLKKWHWGVNRKQSDGGYFWNCDYI